MNFSYLYRFSQYEGKRSIFLLLYISSNIGALTLDKSKIYMGGNLNLDRSFTTCITNFLLYMEKIPATILSLGFPSKQFLICVNIQLFFKFFIFLKKCIQFIHFTLVYKMCLGQYKFRKLYLRTKCNQKNVCSNLKHIFSHSTAIFLKNLILQNFNEM